MFHAADGCRVTSENSRHVEERTAGEVVAIKRGTQQMPHQGEVLVYQPEDREESLGAIRVAKSPHASLAFAGWLMAVLGAVVHAGSGV